MPLRSNVVGGTLWGQGRGDKDVGPDSRTLERSPSKVG